MSLTISRDVRDARSLKRLGLARWRTLHRGCGADRDERARRLRLSSDATLRCTAAKHGAVRLDVPPPGTFQRVAVGYDFACAIAVDGALRCWGKTPYGVPSGTFTQVSVSSSVDGKVNHYSHACAVRTDGTVACWGENEAGQSTPPAGAFVEVAAGGHHSCAIRQSGGVVCWGGGPAIQVPAGM